MSEVKHTAGPWRTKRGCDVYGENGRFLCSTESPFLKTANEEDRANANLISAAPELLAALDKMILAFDSLKLMDYEREAVDAAKEAVAKAKVL